MIYQASKSRFLNHALCDDAVPGDAGVAIEYRLPQSSRRIDFVIAGEDACARPKVVIVELEQRSESPVRSAGLRSG